MPQTIPFTKGHGTGNRFGIGGDGVLRVVRSTAIDEGAEAADSGAEWFMDYRNADGSKAEMCGNGVRVFVRYLVDVGWADVDGDPLKVGTRAGIKTVTRSDRGYAVDLGPF